MIHVEGGIGSEFVRQSSGTRAWAQALEMIKRAERLGWWERPVPPLEEPEGAGVKRRLIAEVVDEYLSDCESTHGRHLSGPTVTKYRTLLNRLNKFAQDNGYATIDQLTFPALTAWRRTWTTGPQSTANNIARLRSFFRYAVKASHVERNFAEDLDMPRGFANTERWPFSQDEMAKILKAAREIPLDSQADTSNAEIEALTLVMRYAGLAIVDAALLKRAALVRDEIRYYRQKTRRSARPQLVAVPVPAFVVEKLKGLPKKNGDYFFAVGSIENATDVWHKRLAQVFALAGVRDGTSHRFRHTFATTLLTQGISVELVSRWLGHASVRVTEKHYSHYLETRIKAANDVLRGVYSNAS